MRGRQWCGLHVVGVLLAACGDGGESAAPGSSASSSTVAVSATVEASTSTTVAIGTWSRPCTEYVRDTPSVPVVDEATLGGFGPLGHEPGLTIELPMVNASFKYPVPTATRIPGGVLVAASTDRTSYQADGSLVPAGTVVAAIDDDGSVRWVRCLDRTAQVSGALGAQGYITMEWETYDTSATVHTIDLADGTLGDEVTELPGQLTPLPYPNWVQPGETLAFYSADNELQWSDDDFVHLGGESWNVRDVGSIVLAVGCPADQVSYNTDSGCRTPMMRGYRSRDGRVLWERPGMFWLSLGLGGFAIVSDADGGYRMIDTKTGVDIPGQSWSYEVGFPQGCCADWSTWSQILGGVVITSFDNTLRVYYPLSAGVAPHTVVLP